MGTCCNSQREMPKLADMFKITYETDSWHSSGSLDGFAFKKSLDLELYQSY